MTDEMFAVFIQMLICADPWPITQDEYNTAAQFADFEARKRGFKDWIAALHHDWKKEKVNV